MKFKMIAPLIVFGLFIAVIAQNSQAVSVRFLMWESNLSLIILLLFTALFGFGCGFVLALSTRRTDKAADQEK
ncbi:MAG: DUF1049 domain-containing protein [Chrysiogenetes bacterium]|nr:DUF1049 domain-containing protein [Chrysiogenetes bacterium]